MRFSLPGDVNKQCCRSCGTKRLQEVYEVQKGTESIMVQCVIYSKGIIALYILKLRVSEEKSTKKCLTSFHFQNLRLPPERMFQQDGAPAHLLIFVYQYLVQMLGSRWIGKGGPVLWPAKFPDLTPCDLFLQGSKGRAFRILFSTIPELKAIIRAAISLITEQTFQTVVANTGFRMRLLSRQNRARFGNLSN